MTEEVGAIAISFDHQIAEGEILRFHVGVAEDAAADTIDRVLDKLTAASERQARQREVKKLQAQLKQEEELYVKNREDLVRIDAEAEAEHVRSGRRTPYSPDKMAADKRQVKQQRENMDQRIRDSVNAIKARLGTLQAVNGADRAANSR